MVRIIENMNISESCRSCMILSLFLRISEICCFLTPYSVGNLVPFPNHKIVDCLQSMERKDRLRFEDMTNSF